VLARRLTRRHRLILAGAILAALGLSCWGSAERAARERAELTAAWRDRLTAMASDRVLAIDEWLAARLAEARLVATDPAARAALEQRAVSARWSGRQGAVEDGLSGFLSRAVRAGGGQSAWVVDSAGREVARGDPDDPLPVGAGQVAVEAMASRRSSVQMALLGSRRAPGVVLATSIAAQHPSAAPLGAAVIAVDPQAFLYPLLASEPNATRTGETLLVGTDGNVVRFLSPLRHRQEAPLAVVVPLSAPNLAGAAALAGRDEFGEFVDYRGERVLGATRRLQQAHWALVVKVDRREAFAELPTRLLSEALTFVSGVVALSGLAYGLWWRQRARLRASLAQTEVRYRRLVEVANEGIWTLDADLRTDFVNAKLAEWLGYEVAEVVGLPVSAFIFPEDYADHAHQMQARRRGESGIYERRLRCRDGSERWMVVGETAIQDAAGRFGGLLAMLTDITARRHAEAALRDNEARLRAVLDTAVEAIVTTDEGGRIESLNPAAQRLFRLDAGGAVGRGLGDLVPALASWEPSAGGAAREVEGVCADGARLPLSAAVSVFEAGGRRGRTAMMRDLTEIKQAETKLREAQAQLQHAQKMEAIGRLAGGVAHDFNNLLGIIQGFGDMARRALPEEHPVQRRLQTMLKAAEKGANLTRQLLAFARREPQEAVALDVNRVVADLDSMLRRLIGEDIALLTRLAESVPRVKGDAGQLEQVIVNLAVNGRDAMPQGGRLTIETSVEEPSPDAIGAGDVRRSSRVVRLSVSDTGCGMDEGTLARAFEPFFTTKPVGKGTGLGLSIVYGIVTQVGGHVRGESVLGRGTTFHVLLPALVESEGVEGVKPRGEHPAAGGSETVLVVEDDGDLREIVAESLRDHGYRVLVGATGEEALRLVAQFLGEFDLLLTDVVMPEMSGKDLAGRLKAMYPAMRVLFMSGYTDDTFDRYELSLDEGAFIEKPFTAERLVREIRAALTRPAESGGSQRA
jgi:PAS domain S-box-containing protein